MEVANVIVKSIGAYHLIRYEVHVGVRYWECPLLEVPLYACAQNGGHSHINVVWVEWSKHIHVHAHICTCTMYMF